MGQYTEIRMGDECAPPKGAKECSTVVVQREFIDQNTVNTFMREYFFYLWQLRKIGCSIMDFRIHPKYF